MRKIFAVVAVLGCTVLFMGAGGDDHTGGCTPSAPPTAAERQSRDVALQVDAATTENNEANNIGFKRMTMGKPGLIGYIVFLSQDGRPVQYYAVKGKCTSGSKRLTQAKREEFLRAYGKDAKGDWMQLGGSWEAVDGPGEDGTYGPSDPYIYCRTTNDAYVQWNGLYLYQTQPFDLTIKPLVVDLSGKEQAQ